jgi:16S rRNA (cytidine1402-2'-O)-methyltransferase
VLFIGFLPTRTAALQAEIASWAASRAAVVFFESTRRLARTLAAVKAEYPQARVAVGRELTKLFEEIVNLGVEDAMTWLNDHATLKGEVTVMVIPGVGAAAEQPLYSEDELIVQARLAFKQGASLKDLLRKYQDVGLKRADLYNLLLRAKDEGE